MAANGSNHRDALGALFGRPDRPASPCWATNAVGSVVDALSGGEAAVSRNRAEQYRRRARECLEIVLTLSPRRKRAMLTDMAQTWLQLAEEIEAPPIPVEHRPVI
jgi:hypothetical protein